MRMANADTNMVIRQIRMDQYYPLSIMEVNYKIAYENSTCRWKEDKCNSLQYVYSLTKLAHTVHSNSTITPFYISSVTHSRVATNNISSYMFTISSLYHTQLT